MKYRAFIFDMDGTLVHNMPIHNQAFLDTLAEAGARLPADPLEFLRSVSGKKTGDIFRDLLGSDLSDSEVARWTERKEALYRERYACCREPMPGLLDLLEKGSVLGISMAVASAAPPENVNFILDGIDLRRYFQAVVSGQDVRHGKPHPEIFLKSAQALGVAPADCLVFEDAMGGIEAAARAGMDAVLLTTSVESRAVSGLRHVLHAVPDFTSLNLPALLHLDGAGGPAC